MNRLTSVGKSSKARSIQIVKFDEKKKSFSLNDSNFKELFLKDDLKDREVVVISVAGAVRKGKSFLLSMFLRYLDAKVSIFLFSRKNINSIGVILNY